MFDKLQLHVNYLMYNGSTVSNWKSELKPDLGKIKGGIL